MKTFENIINNLWSIQNPCYGWLKHKYSLDTNISKSHLKYQDLPIGNAGGRKIVRVCFL